MISDVQLQSITAVNEWFLFTVFLIIIGLIIGLETYYRKYSGTGGRYDPKVLWRKYGAVLIVLLVIGFGYLNLDVYCSFEVTSDKSSYNAGEVIELNCTITNPLPVPVYYRGYRMITIEARYPDGSKVERTQLTISEAAAQVAAEEARAASGAVVGSGFIMPNGEKTVKTVRYTPMHEGEIIVEVEYDGLSKSISQDLSQSIGKFSPQGATVNSTGITLLLEKSDDPDNPTILIKVQNDNPYPVRIPVFYELVKHYGVPDSEAKTVVFIDWVVHYFDIPAYSTQTIFDTDATASENRTPIYYTLYGVTLRYPPEN